MFYILDENILEYVIDRPRFLLLQDFSIKFTFNTIYKHINRIINEDDINRVNVIECNNLYMESRHYYIRFYEIKNRTDIYVIIG